MNKHYLKQCPNRATRRIKASKLIEVCMCGKHAPSMINMLLKSDYKPSIVPIPRNEKIPCAAVVKKKRNPTKPPNIL